MYDVLDVILKEDVINGGCSTHGRVSKCVHNLSGKSEEITRKLEAFKEDNIKMYVKTCSVLDVGVLYAGFL
jgi:hypothetical protein